LEPVDLDRLIDRRAFIGGLALAAVRAADAARAQTPRKVYRVGILSATSSPSDMAGPEPGNPGIRALLGALRELGYVYGEHFVTETVSAEGQIERFPTLAAELARRNVDVILAVGPSLPAVKQATSTIPVVMLGAADPVAQGLAQSLRRPGGNFTGMSLQLAETTAKRLELLRELAPGRTPIAVLWESLPGPAPSWQAAESAARERRWKLLSLEIQNFGGEVERAFKAASAARTSGLLVLPGASLDRRAERIAELAMKHRLPAMYALRRYVEAGGLACYSADILEIPRRAAVFVDKILKGARAGDLPIEQATKYELVVNLEAARAIGLAIPQSFLARANEIIR
jgi:putative ABC transport system substrate-binding protein